MNLSTEEQDLTRWIDGELSEEESERLLREHPEWRDEAEAAGVLGDQLRAAVSIEREMPYADFFNNQIRRQIDGDVFSGDPVEERAQPIEDRAPSAAPGSSLFQRLRWLSAAGFVACLGALVALVINQPPGDRSEVVSTYTPDPNVSVTTTYHADADATVIQLSGAPAVSAAAAAMTENDRKRLGRVLFNLQSEELNRPVSVLSRNATDEIPGAILIGF